MPSLFYLRTSAHGVRAWLCASCAILTQPEWKFLLLSGCRFGALSPVGHGFCEFCLSPWDSLQDKPLPSPNLALFVEPSSVWVSDGHRRAAYMVVTLNAILEIQGLLLEICYTEDWTALIQALTLAQGKCVNIYTDSNYASFIAHAHSANLKERGFRTTKGNPILNASLINKLLQVFFLSWHRWQLFTAVSLYRPRNTRQQQGCPNCEMSGHMHSRYPHNIPFYLLKRTSSPQVWQDLFNSGGQEDPEAGYSQATK